MIETWKDINSYLRVKSNGRGIEYYCSRNDARLSFHPRDKYKMIKVIQIILDKNSWRDGRNSWGKVTDTMKFASAYRNLIEEGLGDIEYFGNNWYKIDLEEVLKDLKLSSLPIDVLKNKNVDKLKEILKGMSLEELIYLHESGVVNE